MKSFLNLPNFHQHWKMAIINTHGFVEQHTSNRVILQSFSAQHAMMKTFSHLDESDSNVHLAHLRKQKRNRPTDMSKQHERIMLMYTMNSVKNTLTFISKYNKKNTGAREINK